jgi:alkyl hydroperoxide reductase subunit F
MLEQSFKDQIRSIFEGLKSNFTFKIEVNPGHANREELFELLQEVASCSGKIDCQISDGEGLSFSLLKDGVASSIIFRAIPTGHEFSSLLLAILNMDGIGKNIPDEMVIKRIQALKGPVHIQSFISLTCTNCPDVVQAINVMAILNNNIKHEIIDGGINKSDIEELNIQAVPTVYANGGLLHVGRSDLGELLGKLEEKFGTDYKPASAEVKNFDVIVVGGGPAGVSAAIYSARKGLKVVVVTDHVGGQLNETLGIENMISIPKTTGTQLVADLRLHLKEYPMEILENRKIEQVELVNGLKHVRTSMGEILKAPALIIASGASWRRLNVPGESDYIGSGVAFCAHCDGPFYKNKRVAVVGGGNSRLEAAIDLSSLATEITVLEFMHELKGDQVLQDKIKAIPNVSVITGAETRSIDGDGSKVTSIQLKDRNSGLTKKMELDGVFVQIGLLPNSQIFKNIVELNKYGEILIDAHCRTNIPGVYAAGDVTNVPYKQIIIAMGEGSKAALTAFEDKIKDKLLAN